MGPNLISGLVLKMIAGVDPRTHDVYQEIRGGEDLLIRDGDLVDLSQAGVEKFFTAIAQTTEGLSIVLPPATSPISKGAASPSRMAASRVRQAWC